MKEVTIYTDGACSGNPGPGGWSCILIYKDQKKEMCGAEEYTTNNRMELKGVIRALSTLKEQCKVSIYSDSAYVVNALNEGWIEKWKNNGWKTASKKPVKNKDLWDKFLSLLDIHDITFVKVQGHADVELNERCDELAKEAIRRKAYD